MSSSVTLGEGSDGPQPHSDALHQDTIGCLGSRKGTEKVTGFIFPLPVYLPRRMLGSQDPCGILKVVGSQEKSLRIDHHLDSLSSGLPCGREALQSIASVHLPPPHLSAGIQKRSLNEQGLGVVVCA